MDSCLVGASEPNDFSDRVAEIVRQGRDAWPDLVVDDEVVVEYVTARVSTDEDPERAFARLRPGDLYFACACAQGDEKALAAFRSNMQPVIREAVARAAPSAAVDEVTQRVMTRLFVGGPRSDPIIVRYGGRGDFAAWLRIIAARDAYKFLGRERGHLAVSEIEALADRTIEVSDPELQNLKRIYRSQFKQAFGLAFERLTSKERNILRYEYLDGLNIDKIGTIYGVHRATVARWRTKAREALFHETRKVFEEDLKVTRKEFDSILRLIESQLDISLSRLLESDGD